MTDLSVCNSDQLTGDRVSLNVDTSASSDYKPGLGLPFNHASAIEPLIVHAGAIVSMIHLLPSIACQQQPQVTSVQVLSSSSSSSFHLTIIIIITRQFARRRNMSVDTYKAHTNTFVHECGRDNRNSQAENCTCCCPRHNDVQLLNTGQ